jgi:UDP-glucuronate 4-epimerase
VRTAFITGTAGFIGFHLARQLLDEGWVVHGYDGITDYYDVSLKHRRHSILKRYENFAATEAMLEDADTLITSVKATQPDVIIHLAAQAGVRYSIDNPRAYVDANIIGTFNLMEAALLVRPAHLLMASTSSVYGANTDMPYSERDKADTQMSFYAATKKANEAMAHSWAHIHDLPITMFRFFTVYGPWGRPDMALFKFTRAILNGEPIDVYNNGDMWRDFTYVTDLVEGIRGLIDTVPGPNAAAVEDDSLSPVAPYRVVNVGNSEKVRLEDFIDAIEAATNTKAIRNYMPMQQGDVPATWADATLLRNLTGNSPRTEISDGVTQFVDWYRGEYSTFSGPSQMILFPRRDLLS